MWPPTSSNAWNGQPAYWKGLACHQTPDDLWNFAETVWQLRPSRIVEVGTGEGGTAAFLQALGIAITAIDKDDPAPDVGPRALVILDGDVYSSEAIRSDLETYGQAQWLVVCHTVREDWGSARALADWWPVHPEWTQLPVRHATRHTWLTR